MIVSGPSGRFPKPGPVHFAIWKIFILFSCIALNTNLNAQSEDPDLVPVKQFTVSASTAGHLSFTGINLSAGAFFNYGKFSVYTGPKWNISQSYTIGRGPFGLILTGYFFPNGPEKSISGFVNLDYQLGFLKPVCPSGVCSGKLSLIHEYSIGYGFLWNAGRKISLLNSIGIGIYSENLFNTTTGKRFRNNGFNSMVKIGIQYEI